MEFSDIQQGLEGFTEKYDSQTYLGSYRETNRGSLLSPGLSTRANSLWKMAQYVVAKFDQTTEPIDKYIIGWKLLASRIGNQFLIIEESKDSWAFYDSQGNRLGKEDYIKEYFKEHQKYSQVQMYSNYFQHIYYGAPGTGKSNEIKRLTGDGTFTKGFIFRTTFHPDSDYSSFVGAYKPIWKDPQIIYEFRPQTFLKAYIAAWTHPDKNVALVIEEINRGNCAQIFGDIFQLLDREDNGLSKYPIEADMDMKEYLNKALNGGIKEPWAGTISQVGQDEINKYYSKHYDDTLGKISSGEILVLPKNLSIFATMNTSDQSLFPMDSAFKRRWEWIYQPIVKGIDSETGEELKWKISIDGYKPIDWWEFLKRINRTISNLTTTEDKQLGYFFCMPDAMDFENKKTFISANRFVGKVIFYLWNDVFKDYAFDADCCKDSNNTEVLYAQFYNADGKSININVLIHFFETLKTENEVSLIGKNEPKLKDEPKSEDSLEGTETDLFSGLFESNNNSSAEE